MKIYVVTLYTGKKVFKSKEEAEKAFHFFGARGFEEVETFEPEENFKFYDGKTFAEMVKG